MDYINPRHVQYQAKRFIRQDWQRYMRPDWERFMRPDWRDPKYWDGGLPPAHLLELADRDVRRAKPVSAEEIAAAEQEIERERRALQKSVDELRLELAAIKREMLLRRLAAKAYNPNQPRVPKGNDGAGEWTSDGATGSRIRFASSEKPRLGPSAIVQIATETAKRLLDAYRSENGLRDLFGRNRGTVAVTTIDGINVYGSNSNSPTYTVEDRSAAESMRNALSERYPELMYSDHPGGMPKNALFHAETTILLRSARQNFGTLAGRSLDIYVDRGMCNNCEQLLPYVGLELGDPEVTFIGPTGIRRTMRGGSWVERRK